MHIVFAVGFFVDNKYEDKAGMPGYVIKISKLLTAKGHLVEIVAGASNSRQWMYDEIKVYNAQWYGDITGNVIDINKAIIRRERAIQKILSEINDNNPIDVVQYAGWSGVGALHRISCPSVLRLSTYSKVQYKESELFKNFINVYSFWERMAGRRASGIIGPGKIILEQFTKDIHRKGTLIETPFEDNQRENDCIFREKLCDKRYILFYGTASKDKGFLTISEMIPELLKRHTELYFVFIGWDVKNNGVSSVETLRNATLETKERMICIPPLDKCYLYPIVRKAEVVLIPSIIDNLPNTCIEAISLGQIVVGTYGSSLEQLIEDDINGFLSMPGDAKDLLRCTEKILGLSIEEREQKRLASEKIAQKYKPDVAVKKLEEYYENLVKKR